MRSSSSSLHRSQVMHKHKHKMRSEHLPKASEVGGSDEEERVVAYVVWHAQVRKWMNLKAGVAGMSASLASAH